MELPLGALSARKLVYADQGIIIKLWHGEVILMTSP